MSKAKIVSKRGRQLTLTEKWAIDSRDTTVYGYNEKGERVPFEELFPNDGDIDHSAEFEEGITYTFG
uniref:Uncharacterized protein n=1 Tax=Myoviridae sp. ctpiG4 TaxID=2826698 RepID=A0A8S5N388_9CAUD|nr:MAG TPA: hypothetical protein [Myoviridae sp. ctpiG4]